MTAAAPSRRLTIALVAAFAALVAITVLLTPRSDDDDRLTITRAGANNAKLFAQLAARLGWAVRTSDTPFPARGDTGVIHVVLDGPLAMTPRERGHLLATVRAGGRALVVTGPATNALLDSLGVVSNESGTLAAPKGLRCTPAQNRRGLRTWPGGTPLLLVVDPPLDSLDRPLRPLPAGSRSFVDVTVTRSVLSRDSLGRRRPVERTRTASALLGIPLGAGRIVVASDGDVVRTDVLRVCEWGMGVAAVRALEWLAPGRRPPLLVAERYQRDVDAGGALAVTREALVGTRPGRATLALAAAGLLLLAALGRRTLVPRALPRERRRSPLEHVDALATAWARVQGTRTVARQLAAGVRRRHGTVRLSTLDDAAFLRAIAARHPDVGDDAARLERALSEPVAPDELPALRRAAARLDAACLAP